ncbi:1,2-phenylacetyl-CoA epoxidase subunit PaaD [Marinicella meishanensis]|uniref:1,2-phenylacetyl-CoA epoxidase subunit PaaD n=1 Tax=Marinicella meishanensis TaxID=2873263 RepID=UPI001CBF1D4E|nr:1,2-phenylacetyl-CoA epoxidase subunit PaaD [Marinicella sp. NBU2979]
MASPSKAQIFQWLEAVKDPEIPVISIRDLGILQGIRVADGSVSVDIIPTYSGCPAMYAIQADIKQVLQAHGIEQVSIQLCHEPVWNTDMITEQGRESMRAFGIAPPLQADQRTVACPQCGSTETTCISQFGSTACKALYRCEACLEPFDYFKCHA